MNKLLVENKDRKKFNYNYGSVAYELQPEVEIKKGKEQKPKQVKSNKKANLVKLKLVTYVMALSLAGLAITSRFAIITNLSGNNRKINAEIKQAQSLNQDLTVELAKINNLRHVDQIASEEYMMVSPDNKNTVYINAQGLTKKSSDMGSEGKGALKLFGLIR